MDYFRIRNFEEFQHYKHRNPPWIRLYYRLLRDRRFYKLSDRSKYVVIGLFLLASQYENKIPFDRDWIRNELNYKEEPDWQEIVNAEFIIPIDCNASKMLATCYQDASQSRVDNSETEILSVSPKSAKSSVMDCIEILKHWNLQPATIHHRAVNGQEKAIKTSLRRYTPEEIKRAIERYSQVRANEAGKYRSLYAWTLGEFLTRQNHYNIERFNADNWEAPFLAGAFASGKPGDSRQTEPEQQYEKFNWKEKTKC